MGLYFRFYWWPDDLAIIDIIQRTANTCFPEADIISTSTFEEAVVYLYNLASVTPIGRFFAGPPNRIRFSEIA